MASNRAKFEQGPKASKKASMLSYEDELCDRLRQIPLSSPFCGKGYSGYWVNSVRNTWHYQQSCRPLVKATKTCKSATGLARTYPHSSKDSKFFAMHRSPCIDLRVIGKKAKLHRREPDENSFLVRSRNYSNHLKQLQQEKARRKTLRCKAITSKEKSNVIDYNENTNTQMCVVEPEQPCLGSSAENMGHHRYLMYHSSYLEPDGTKITVMSPSSSASDEEPEHHHQQQRNSSFNLSLRSLTPSDSGCVSSISFSNVDFSLTCKTPDDSLIALPSLRNKLYPVACPAFPMVESFPVCKIPEPDVW